MLAAGVRERGRERGRERERERAREREREREEREREREREHLCTPVGYKCVPQQRVDVLFDYSQIDHHKTAMEDVDQMRVQGALPPNLECHVRTSTRM